MVSAEAILRDHQNNVIDCAQLPLHFNISGKGKQQSKPKKAQKRAVRGISAQQHRIYLSSHLDNLLMSDTNTYSVAPGIIPVVSASVNPSALDTQHVDDGTVEWITSHVGIPVGDNRQTSNSVLCLFYPLSPPPISGNSDQQPPWVDLTTGILSTTNPLFWPTASAPTNALPFMTSTAQQAVQTFELGVSPCNLGMVFL